jgi:PilZ domain
MHQFGGSTKLNLDDVQKIRIFLLARCVPPFVAALPLEDCMPGLEVSLAVDRRIDRRHDLKTALRVRMWKSTAPDQRGESVNISRRGIFFATDSPPKAGETIEIFLKMPEEVSGEPTTEWRCTGHVLRVKAINSALGKFGVGVQFDCYEVSRFDQERRLSGHHGLRWRPAQGADR